MTQTPPPSKAPTDKIIFHLCRWLDWKEGINAGQYAGSEIARQDGFLHLSTLATVEDSANLHMSGLTDLYVLAITAADIEADLKWEYSETRGTYFPHLYGTLPLNAVIAALPVPLGAEEGYIFPDLNIF